MAKGSKIRPRSQDYAAWYLDVIRNADLAEAAEVVKGCMVIKPHGYAIWERMQAELDGRFKATGHKNAYFPIFIPQSFLQKEAEHVEGFSPECAVVTIGGGKQLEEPYVIRPTSETIIGHFFAKWINSWRDLPLLINQWANVVRWEMRTRMFLRTSEFLWQEGHTAHASHEEGIEETLRILDLYAEFAETCMAMPVIKGLKTTAERFPGAVHTYAIEAMMASGLALQAGTSHDLGQNFGRAFDVKFQSKTKTLEYVWQTSWGVSTRLVGALIMSHSDDNGLVLPPKLAPIHVAIVPIYRKDDERAVVVEKAHAIGKALRDETGLIVEVDDREGYKPGYKFFHWEQRGVPARMEIGPRDVAAGQVVIKRRDSGEKQTLAMDDVTTAIPALMDDIQSGLLAAAKQRLADNTVTADSFEEVAALLKPVSAEKGGGKFVMAHLVDKPECDAKIKSIKATVRCIPVVDEHGGPGPCIVTGETAPQRVVIAKAY